MSGYTEVIKTLKEIRDFLHSKLTPELMSSLQATLNTIQRTLGDPNLQASLNQLKILLENANKNNLVEEMANMAKDIRNILKDVDPKAVANIINTLNDLLSAADKANMIQNITKALESVSCLRDLLDVANQLVLPAKFFLYGTTGALIGVALTTAIQAYLSNKKDKQLQQSIDQLVAINAQQLYVQIQQLRTAAGTYLLKIEIAQQQNGNFVLPEKLIRLRDEQTLILNVLSPVDINSLELLQKAQEFGHKMLRTMYQAELDNEQMSNYLDRVNDHSTHREELIDFVAYFPQYRLFGKKEKPSLPRDELNYQQLRKLYGEKAIDTMMNGLATEFATHGGNDLFFGLANSFEDGTAEFSECIKQISNQTIDFVFQETPWSAGANQLLQYYHRPANGAQHYLTTQWENAVWIDLGHAAPPILTSRIMNIIRARAYIEFCHKTAPYLCFPCNIPRDMMNGVVDIPMGLWQIVRHPINTLQGVGSLLTVNGWVNLGTSIYNHPTRVLTTQAVSAGITAGVNQALHAPAATSSSSHLSQGSRPTLFKAPIKPSIPAPSSLSTSALASGAATGTLPAGITPHQHGEAHHKTENQEVELSSVPLPAITDALLLQLIERLKTTKDITSTYNTITGWYDTINPPIISANEENAAIPRRPLPANSGVASSLSMMLGNVNKKENADKQVKANNNIRITSLTT